MNKKFRENEVQFDYFSDNFHQFEEDFYTYASVDTPLTFLVDDLLYSMASAQRNYFKLDFRNALDGKNHFFHFKIRAPKEAQQIRIYEYIGHTFNKDNV